MDLIVNEQPDKDLERAKRAVNRFRAMLPGLNGYVRAISGNHKLYIQMASGEPRTDGRRIYFEPPIALGDDLTHERRLCDKRDPQSLKQLCHGCAVREDLLIKIYHEIAHNLYGTFKMEARPAELKNKIMQEVNKLNAKRVEQIQKGLYDTSGSYLELAGKIDQFLPTLVNALEDLRVDEAMFQARKGTRIMFHAMTRDTFVNGIERADGTIAQWRDMPLNAQALVGIFVLGTGYQFEGWFDPKVEAALNDEKIQNLVKGVDKLDSALDTFERAFPLLERLRELGFCLSQEEYDQKEQESDQQDDNSSEEAGNAGDSGDGESSDEVSDQADPEESGNSGQHDMAGEHDEGSGGDGGALEEASAEQVQGSSEEVHDSDGAASGDDEVGDERPGSREAFSSAGDGSGVRPEQRDSDEHGNDGGAKEGEQEDHGGSGRDGDARNDSGSGEESDQGQAGDPPESPMGELTDEESDSGREDSGSKGDSDQDVIDTGADEGRGGIPLREQYGTAEEAEDVLDTVSRHGNYVESAAGEQRVAERTIVQALYFETESGTVASVKEHFAGDACEHDAWTAARGDNPRALCRRGVEVDIEIGEEILGPALLHMRRVFADNARAKVEPHLRSGRVNARVLGKRAPFHDPRLFQKKRLPGKKSYAVILGIDISGSTVGVNIGLAKLSALAQAELCSRLGIDFAIYAHTASKDYEGYTLDMYAIKEFDSPWDTKSQNALMSIGSWSDNLDGHSIEYYRKKIEKHPATDKIILYYTDGKMPAANHDEELEILQREIKTCKRLGVTLLGVGIRTDSPIRHGLDTVQVEGPGDVGSVVRHLESYLLQRR